jgi:hypothetical protein
MRTVVICTERNLAPSLETTVLWRHDFSRQFAATLEDAQRLAASAALVLVERDLSWAADAVKALRRDSATRAISMAILAPDEFSPVELALLEAGANGVLRLPADDEWDKRLARLLQVATRKQARVPIHLQVEATFGESGEPFVADTVDISETGMLIESALRLEVAQELDFAFQLPSQSGLVSGRARVARQAKGNRFGLEFTSLSGEALEVLRAFVASELPAE